MMTQSERKIYNAFLTAEWREEQIVDAETYAEDEDVSLLDACSDAALEERSIDSWREREGY